MSVLRFVIEHPKSTPSEPRYLILRGVRFHGQGAPKPELRFDWEFGYHCALKFSTRDEALDMMVLSQTLQPDLWRDFIGHGRVCEHGLLPGEQET